MATPTGERPPPRGGEAAARRAAAALPRMELSPAVRNRLIESRLTPNFISMAGLSGNVVAAVLVWQELFVWAGLAFIAGSVLDTLDGAYSRMSDKGTPFGAFLDSTLDRVAEGVVLTGVAAVYADRGDDLGAALVVVAVLGSLMVSYTRARAEALGVACTVGIASRAVRVVILSAGLLFAEIGDGLTPLDIAVYVLAALATITTVQRVFHVRGELRRM